jgi:hypothetical protein
VADQDFFLRVPLDVQGSVDPQKLRGLLEFVHEHRQRIRHLVIHHLDGFLPDDFRGQKSLWLVGDLVLRKIRLALRQLPENFVQ